MSFSMNIKEEISKIDCTKTEKIAELSAIIRNSSTQEPDSLKITIENNSVARRIYKLFKEIYDINLNITIRRRYGFNTNLIYIFKFNKKHQPILEDLSIYNKKGEYIDIPHEYIINDNEDLRAYLRGLFMTSGSVNDPQTSRYHLELVVDTSTYANFINKILKDYNLNSKIIKREKNYMVYIKEAEKISDFLRIIKAYNAVMYYEDIRIYRDHVNMTNRLNNCEQANVDRTIQTANNQLTDIEIIKEKLGLELLNEKEKLVAEYRLKYKDVSLLELSEIISIETGKPITKSGLYHRFKKISEIAKKLKENK